MLTSALGPISATQEAECRAAIGEQAVRVSLALAGVEAAGA
jgi:hypothetical protein